MKPFILGTIAVAAWFYFLACAAQNPTDPGENPVKYKECGFTHTPPYRDSCWETTSARVGQHRP